jgi:hypothetical protein
MVRPEFIPHSFPLLNKVSIAERPAGAYRTCEGLSIRAL